MSVSDTSSFSFCQQQYSTSRMHLLRSSVAHTGIYYISNIYFIFNLVFLSIALSLFWFLLSLYTLGSLLFAFRCSIFSLYTVYEYIAYEHILYISAYLILFSQVLYRSQEQLYH